MRHWYGRTFTLIAALATLCVYTLAYAEDRHEEHEHEHEHEPTTPGGVALGVVGGVNWQINNKQLTRLSEAYGFFVDIPLISTFCISPEATIYRINLLGKHEDGAYGSGVTDIDINFKFVLPLGASRFELGMRGGTTIGVKFETGFPMTVNFGFLAGYDYHFLPNFALTIRSMWEFMPSNEGNLYKLFFLGGFRFIL